jgi:hypothetical protein
MTPKYVGNMHGISDTNCNKSKFAHIGNLVFSSKAIFLVRHFKETISFGKQPCYLSGKAHLNLMTLRTLKFYFSCLLSISANVWVLLILIVLQTFC